MASAPVAISGFDRPAFLKRWRPSGAQILWLAFVIVQALDGVMSYVGVSLHGPGIEANPLVGWYLSAFGPAVGFTMASALPLGRDSHARVSHLRRRPLGRSALEQRLANNARANSPLVPASLNS